MSNPNTIQIHYNSQELCPIMKYRKFLYVLIDYSRLLKESH